MIHLSIKIAQVVLQGLRTRLWVTHWFTREFYNLGSVCCCVYCGKESCGSQEECSRFWTDWWMDGSLVNKRQHFSKQLASSFAFGPWQLLWAESQSILWLITQLTMTCVTRFLHRRFHSEQYDGSNETFLSPLCFFFSCFSGFWKILSDSNMCCKIIKYHICECGNTH